jgi:hypothetical protein
MSGNTPGVYCCQLYTHMYALALGTTPSSPMLLSRAPMTDSALVPLPNSVSSSKGWQLRAGPPGLRGVPEMQPLMPASSAAAAAAAAAAVAQQQLHQHNRAARHWVFPLRVAACMYIVYAGGDARVQLSHHSQCHSAATPQSLASHSRLTNQALLLFWPQHSHLGSCCLSS